MESFRIRSVRVVLVGIAVALTSLSVGLVSQPAYAAPANPKVLPVLLVHGYDGWGNSKSDWITGGWISKDITEVGHGSGWAVYKDKKSPGIFDTAPVYMLDYHGYKDAKGPLKQNSGILAMAIDVVTKDSGAADAYVVAHSQGGLMTRAVLVGMALDPNGGTGVPYKNNIFGFMTIDTPHKGSSTNPLFQFTEGGRDMLDDSPFLKELNAVTMYGDQKTFCSVAIGDAQGEANGDALFSVDEQDPIYGTVPFSHYASKKFAVVHGSGMTGIDYKKYTAALASGEVKDWAIARYRQALTEYQEPNAGPKPTPVPPVLPVLLVHGLQGQGDYENDQTKSDWIWGGWISKNPTWVDGGNGWAVYKGKGSPGIFDSAPVYVLDYSDYHGAAGHLVPTAGTLWKAIDIVKQDVGASDVYIVAHSMGGLLTRAVMSGVAVDPSRYADYESQKAMDKRYDVYGFTTIDTPHKGYGWTGVWGGIGDAVGDIAPDSPFMKALNKTPDNIVADSDTLCSVVIGTGWLFGDGMLTADEQTPIAGTVPSAYKHQEFTVVHGRYMPNASGTPALESQQVRNWVVDRYREAQVQYRGTTQPAPPNLPTQPGVPAENTVLAIDHSSSMEESWDTTTKVEGAKSAANSIVSILQGALSVNRSASIGLLQFDDETEVLLPPTSDYASVLGEISSIASDGSTDLIKPIEEGAAQLENVGGGALILLTDGVDEEGNSDDSIIAAADLARSKGIKIFTIGFGTPGNDINEELLKRIAGDDARYSYADPASLVGLAGGFLYSQIAAAEEVLGKFEGAVQQGQTVDAGEFDVASSQGDLQTVLYWPGSTLEMKLTDPSGTAVATGYPGLTIARTETPAQLFISQPKAGRWKMTVYGAETSMDNEPYFALASFKEATAATAPAGGGVVNSGAGLLLGLIAVAFVAIIGFVLYQRKRADKEPSVADKPSLSTGLTLRSVSGTVSVLREGVNTIGRADDQDIILHGETVSRHHAVVVVSGSSVRISDAQSAAGVTVNGLAVTEKELVPGDTIKLGGAVLTLEQGSQD